MGPRDWIVRRARALAHAVLEHTDGATNDELGRRADREARSEPHRDPDARDPDARDLDARERWLALVADTAPSLLRADPSEDAHVEGDPPEQRYSRPTTAHFGETAMGTPDRPEQPSPPSGPTRSARPSITATAPPEAASVTPSPAIGAPPATAHGRLRVARPARRRPVAVSPTVSSLPVQRDPRSREPDHAAVVAPVRRRRIALLLAALPGWYAGRSCEAPPLSIPRRRAVPAPMDAPTTAPSQRARPDELIGTTPPTLDQDDARRPDPQPDITRSPLGPDEVRVTAVASTRQRRVGAASPRLHVPPRSAAEVRRPSEPFGAFTSIVHEPQPAEWPPLPPSALDRSDADTSSRLPGAVAVAAPGPTAFEARWTAEQEAR